MGSILVEVILPVFMVFTIGFIGQKKLKLDIKSVSSVVIYFMMPVLVFRTFYQIDLDATYLYLVLFNFILFYTIVFVVKIISRIRRFPSSIENGLVLASGFMNSGNYGAPVILFAFGELGFMYSISFVVLQTIFMNSFGVYYAAKGNAGFRTALSTVFRIPSIYAFVLAIIWKNLELPIIDSFYQVIDLVANASIPTVMLVLGMQLSQIRIGKVEWEKVSIGIILRLFVSPLIAWLITLWIPLDPLMEKVLIVSAAMPSAATMTMLSLQFDTEPQLVSSITLLTTVLSAGTLSVLLSFY